MILCIAVIGKDNSPLYIKCLSEESEVELHYKVHTSIDIIFEKLNTGNKITATDSRELFLGLLHFTDEHKIFGYATNTKIKFVVVLQTPSTTVRDNDVRMIFRKLHTAYCNVISNPFYSPGDPIQSKSFDATVKDIMGIE
ncbi:trafficking protein particle complex subunit 2-like protein [Cotesia typhae]|uniref:trafficking protein particle complex subunit 2-like protein n=1 Tax=Cotesia typhae TaxID=2053667 RepID=UPI003D695197